MKTYRIIPLPLSYSEQDLSFFTYRYNFGTKITATNYSWYIEGADQPILVDTGGDADTAINWRKQPAKDIMSFEDALAGVGLKPEDIGLIIQTHLHWDHCVNTHKCKNAKVVVTEDELRTALSPHPILASGYHRGLLKDLRFMLVRGEYELAPGIQLIPAPGHTPGTQAVAINTQRGKAVITGFCCVKENFYPPEEVREHLPVIPSTVHLNVIDAFESALRIKGLADILIPAHDSSFAEVKSIP